jgi:biopolymer transport protein ExbD
LCPEKNLNFLWISQIKMSYYKINFMAEQITSTEKGNKTTRLHKKNTRVDLTPMVDLGFLLITFFVFTTTMSTATAMDIVTPNDTDSSVTDDICESCVITVIPAANNKLYYYEGDFESADIKLTDYSAAGLRKVLSDKKNAVKKENREAVLIIKPTAKSSFKNLINIIDESTICMYKRYYLDQFSEKEKGEF